MLDSYHRLKSFLSAQKEALLQGDTRKRDALQLQIERLHKEICGLMEQPGSLPPGSVDELKQLIPAIARSLEENRTLWAEQLERIRKQSSELKSTRRYVAARQEVPSSGPRYQRSG